MNDQLQINVEKIDFLTLIASFAASGMIGMGKIPDPVTHQIEKNLDQVQYAIDVLIMLKEKTAGNLNHEEETILTNAISDLQINYLHEKNS